MCVGAEGREGWKSLPESDEIDEVYSHMGIPVAQVEKNLPAMQETPVPFLGWEVPLEKERATHSSILRLPWCLRP